jgi:hypothetical protein
VRHKHADIRDQKRAAGSSQVKEQAKRNHRFLYQEVVAILEQELLADEPDLNSPEKPNRRKPTR